MLDVDTSMMLPSLVHTPKACFSRKYCSFFIVKKVSVKQKMTLLCSNHS